MMSQSLFLHFDFQKYMQRIVITSHSFIFESFKLIIKVESYQSNS